MASIQGVYVALFGRPADPFGLSFFNTATQNGANLTAVGDLASTAEYQTRFAGQNNTQIVNSIYRSLFNRDADLTGLTFFVNALTNKTLTINNIAIAIFDGAQGSDVTIRDLKTAAANAFTTAIDTTAEVLGYQGTAAANSGVAFLTGVTTTAPTATQVTAAVLAATTAGSGGGGTAGVTLTLTAGVDAFSPDATNSAFKSTANDDTIRGNITAGDLATTDSINAGGGVDTLNALLAAGSAAPVLTSVEKIFLTSSADTAALDASAATGTTEIWNNGNAGGFDLAVTNIKLGTTVGLAGTGSDVTTFGFAAATGTNDSATLAVNAATYPVAAAVTIAAIENLTITQTTTGAATVASIIAADAKSVVVTGSGELTLGTGATNNFSKVTTINASGHTGNFTLNLEVGVAPTVGQTVLASSQGVNTIALDTTTAGVTDVIQFVAGNVSTISRLTTVAGFNEAIDKLDLKAFTLGADTTVGSTVVAVAGDIAGFFTGTARAVLNDATDTVYVDINKDGNFNAGTDLAVVLTGVTAAGFTAADLILA